MRTFLLSAMVALISGAAAADISYMESGMSISFEGCDFDKLINLQNGHVWECREYGYTYHFGTMTVLDVNGTTKLCVGDVEEAIEQFPNGDCYSGTLYRW